MIGLVLLFITDSDSLQLMVKTLNSAKFFMVSHKAQFQIPCILFIIFKSDLHYALIHRKVWHFADDTNLLFAFKPLKKINKFINYDLALVNKRLRANKINLNTTKIKIIIFRAKNKRIHRISTLGLGDNEPVDSGPCTKVKYLGVIL